MGWGHRAGKEERQQRRGSSSGEGSDQQGEDEEEQGKMSPRVGVGVMQYRWEEEGTGHEEEAGGDHEGRCRGGVRDG